MGYRVFHPYDKQLFVEHLLCARWCMGNIPAIMSLQRGGGTRAGMPMCGTGSCGLHVMPRLRHHRGASAGPGFASRPWINPSLSCKRPANASKSLENSDSKARDPATPFHTSPFSAQSRHPGGPQANDSTHSGMFSTNSQHLKIGRYPNSDF